MATVYFGRSTFISLATPLALNIYNTVLPSLVHTYADIAPLLTLLNKLGLLGTILQSTNPMTTKITSSSP